MAILTVEIVSPEKALWAGEANALIARSSEGNFTILPQHTPTVGDIVSSVVRVDTAEGEIAFAVHTGYFQVGPGLAEGETLATVLAGVAERTTEIDVAPAPKRPKRLLSYSSRARRRAIKKTVWCTSSRLPPSNVPNCAFAQRRPSPSDPTRSRVSPSYRSRVLRGELSRRRQWR